PPVRGVQVPLLPLKAAALGALRSRDAVRSPSGALRFVTRLPRPEAPEASSLGAAVLLPPAGPPAPASAARRPPAASGARRPPHVLLDTAAHAIGTEPLVVGTAPPSGARGLRLEGET